MFTFMEKAAAALFLPSTAAIVALQVIKTTAAHVGRTWISTLRAVMAEGQEFRLYVGKSSSLKRVFATPNAKRASRALHSFASRCRPLLDFDLNNKLKSSL